MTAELPRPTAPPEPAGSSIAATPDRDIKRRYSVVFLLAALAAALGLGGAIAWQQGLLRPVAHLYFLADDVTGLAPGNAVRMAGLRVGKVEQLDLQPDLKVRVTLSIEAEHYAPLRADARAELVREQLKPAAIALRPGTADRPLDPADPRVAFRHRGTLTDIAEDLRNKLAPILDDMRVLSRTARDRRDDLDDMLKHAREMSGELAGAARQMHAMTQELNRRSAGLGSQAEAALAETSRSIQRVGTLVGQAERSLDQVNARLPGLLGRSDAVLGQVGGVLQQLDAVLQDTRQVSAAAARDLPLVLRAAPPLLDESRELMQGLRDSWPVRALLPPAPPLLLPLDSHESATLRLAVPPGGPPVADPAVAHTMAPAPAATAPAPAASTPARPANRSRP